MDAIGGLLQAIGRGIAGLFEGTFAAVGGALRGAVAGLQTVLPGLWLPVVVFLILLVLAWTFAKR